VSTQQKTPMLKELDEKLAPLREQKDLLENQAHELAERRNRLNEEFKNLRNEIQHLRNERDQINERVRELKQQRSDLAVKIREKIEEIKKLGQDYRALGKKRPRRSHQALQEEVESIDWKIQTTSHTLQEDKELVDKVKQLEVQLNIHKKLEQQDKKIRDLRAEVAKLKTESERCHQAVTAQAQVSQETHTKMLAKMEKAKKVKTEADDMHKQFLVAKEKAKPMQEHITKITNEIRRLNGEIREEEQKEKKQSEDALRQSLQEKAREKLKRGEKLSWQEFQLLSEEDVTAQD
jgi:uncharacterized coiled-coil DUF342 family protein